MILKIVGFNVEAAEMIICFTVGLLLMNLKVVRLCIRQQNCVETFTLNGLEAA